MCWPCIVGKFGQSISFRIAKGPPDRLGRTVNVTVSLDFDNFNVGGSLGSKLGQYLNPEINVVFEGFEFPPLLERNEASKGVFAISENTDPVRLLHSQKHSQQVCACCCLNQAWQLKCKRLIDMWSMGCACSGISAWPRQPPAPRLPPDPRSRSDATRSAWARTVHQRAD